MHGRRLLSRVSLVLLCGVLLLAAGCGKKNAKSSASTTSYGAGTVTTSASTAAGRQTVTDPTNMGPLDSSMSNLDTDVTNLDSSFSGSEGTIQ